MHTATVHSLDQARQSARPGVAGRHESPRAHERRSSLADAPVHARPVSPVSIDGRALHNAPGGRRPAPHLVDDFGIPAEDPALIADLLLSLEAASWRPPVIRIVRDLSTATRVHVQHGDRVFPLDPADARLAAAALDQEQAFAGCSGLASELRAAANRADWARPYRRADRLARRGPVPLRDRLEAGSGLMTLRAFAAGAVLLALLAAAARLIGAGTGA